MVLGKITERLKAIFSSKPKGEENKHDAGVETPVFDRLEKKRKLLEAEGAEKASLVLPEIAEQAKALRFAILSVANKALDPRMQFYKIATEHQRSFTARLQPLQKQLELMAFPGDYAGLVVAQGKLAEILTAANRVVIDNRYVYAFFEKELFEFNHSMKRLLELNTSLADSLRPAYDFGLKCEAIEEKKKALAAIERQAEFLNNQKQQTAALFGKYTAEEEALKEQWDAAMFEKTKAALDAAAQEEREAEGRLESFLDNLEGALKRYARGKAPGAFASTAERYLHDKKAFLEDCLGKESGLDKLLADLEQNNLTNTGEFKQHRSEWKERLVAARNHRAGLEATLKQVEAPKNQLDTLQVSMKNAQRELHSLDEKVKSMASQKAAEEAWLAKEAERILKEG